MKCSNDHNGCITNVFSVNQHSISWPKTPNIIYAKIKPKKQTKYLKIFGFGLGILYSAKQTLHVSCPEASQNF